MVEVLGVVGIVISVAAYLPQVIHLARERGSAGISEGAWAMWFVSAMFVGSVAVSHREPIFISFQLCSLFSAGAILVLAHRYRGMVCGTHGNLCAKEPEVPEGDQPSLARSA